MGAGNGEREIPTERKPDMCGQPLCREGFLEGAVSPGSVKPPEAPQGVGANHSCTCHFPHHESATCDTCHNPAALTAAANPHLREATHVPSFLAWPSAVF